MRLRLFHPIVASIPCSECQRWFYDFKTGERQTRGGKPIPRSPKLKPPCWECPKESPEKEHEHSLSAKNQQAYEFYLKVKHTSGAYMRNIVESDPIAARNHVIIGQLVEAKQIVELGRMLRPVTELAALAGRGGK